ncbi:hypothetical protein [Clostridium psychrophilum]|nr:hypothetical protein [Clostridium psychrophilum]MBU3180318.1 hypothetical protein [Clostridium psychrophilum]
MKIVLRKPSLKKMISSRTSPKRIIKNSIGMLLQQLHVIMKKWFEKQ